MAGQPEAMPAAAQRRIAGILKHVTDSRRDPCDFALRSSSCASGGGADIEELGSIPLRKHSADYLDEKPEALFDPRRFAATQRPLLEASTLPAEVYSSRGWFMRELERVFMPSWSLVGRVDELQGPGSYLTIDTAWGGPVAVVKGKDNEIRAFANVCAHRGARILSQQQGKAPGVGLICPYHAWTYDFTGKLIISPGMDKSIGFEEENIQLTSVRMETFHGFIFVTHSASAKPLLDCLGDLPDRCAEWFGPNGKVKDMVCVKRRSYEVPCNWKFIYENTCETYHTSVVHKGSLGPMKSTPMEPHQGDWDGVRVPTDRTIVPLPGDFAGEKFPLPAFTDKSVFINLFPSLQINATWDAIWWMYTLPTSETTSRIEMGFCFPRETTALEIFPSRLERYLHRWHVAVTEDNDISLNQQRGLQSVFRKPGRFGQLEFGTHNFNNWLLSKVLDNQLAVWNPGTRVFADKESQSLWSNDDKQLLMLANLVSGSNGPVAAPTTRRKVCVTGATGFIALHLVQQLLGEGCEVIAAVRSASNERKMAPLLAMQKAGRGALRVASGCDLLAPGSFDGAVAGCELCFHTASPFWMDDRIKDPMAELVVPAEAGTLNVLRSCAKSGSVRRVVLTSSFAAIMNMGGSQPWPADFKYSEEHWNVTSAPTGGAFPEPTNVHAYRWSKTAAEKVAWDFVAKEQPQFSLTSLCPPMVLGPNLQHLGSAGDLNQSSLIVLRHLRGDLPFAMPGSVGFVDVRDVAQAHILAAWTPAAAGQRYLCSGCTRTWLEVAHMLRALFPGRPVPSACDPKTGPQPPCVSMDTSKIRRDLAGLEFRALEDTLLEQGRALASAGLLP